jgi:carbamoyl-phosphate synthase large subunit
MIDQKKKVLVAGIGGASLGTEIIKSLCIAGRYEIVGCDISPYAYGHYMDGVMKTALVRREQYIEDILNLCRFEDIALVVPGGEEPANLLTEAKEVLRENGIALAGNSGDVVRLCSNKSTLFGFLGAQNVQMPKTFSVDAVEEIDDAPLPCIIKPATQSGGSAFVQIANTMADVKIAVAYLLQNGSTPVVQEYIPEEEGEYTIGILHTLNGELVGSIALRRMFHAKLSVMSKTDVGLISSGYSQGLINEYADLRRQAENIAELCGSRGPLNIQGRVRDGVLMPFEINPRFSATTYLRALAGFNEVDVFIQNLTTETAPKMPAIQYGYYFRSLNEVHVDFKDIKND